MYIILGLKTHEKEKQEEPPDIGKLDWHSQLSHIIVPLEIISGNPNLGQGRCKTMIRQDKANHFMNLSKHRQKQDHSGLQNTKHPFSWPK